MPLSQERIEEFRKKYNIQPPDSKSTIKTNNSNRLNRLREIATKAMAQDDPRAGLMMEQQSEPQNNDGFFKSTLKGIAAPFTKGIASGVRAIQATPDVAAATFHAVGGNKEAAARHEQEAINTMADPMLGSKTLEGSSNMENLGTAANAGAYLIPGGKLIGAAAGGAIGAGGAAAEQGEGLGGIALSAGMGAVTGGILSKVAPAILKSIGNKIPKGVTNTVTDVGEKVGTKAGKVTRPFKAVYETAIKKPVKEMIEPKLLSSMAKTNDEILNLTAKQANKLASKGQNIGKFLADERIQIPIEDGKIVAGKALETIRDRADVENHILTGILKTEPKQVSLQDVLSASMKKIKSTGVDQQKVRDYVIEQLQALTRQSGGLNKVEGDLIIDLASLNKVKSTAWGNVTNFQTPEASIANDANSSIGRAIKQIIEDNVDDVDIRALNQRLGNWSEAVKLLTTKEGTKVAPRKLSRLFGTTIGAIAGAGTGGTAGSLVGAGIASKVSDIILNPNIPNAIKESILKEIGSTPQGAKIVQEAIDQLNKRGAEMLSRPQLTTGSTIFAEPVDATKMEILPSDKSIQRNPKTGRMQKIFQGTTEQAKKGK